MGGLKQTSGKLQQQMTTNEADTTKKVAEIDSSISIIDQVISKMEQIKGRNSSKIRVGFRANHCRRLGA